MAAWVNQLMHFIIEDETNYSVCMGGTHVWTLFLVLQGAADIKVHVFIDLSVHAGRSLLLMSVYKSSCRKSSIILTED